MARRRRAYSLLIKKVFSQRCPNEYYSLRISASESPELRMIKSIEIPSSRISFAISRAL